MSALGSGVGSGAVSPPEVETCIRIEWPLRCSEKYSRVPSVTRDRLDAPSLVICSDETTAGCAWGDFRNMTTATTAAMATTPAASHGAIFAFRGGVTVVSAVANKARILSFESGAGLAAVPVGEAWRVSISRRRRRKSH